MTSSGRIPEALMYVSASRYCRTAPASNTPAFGSIRRHDSVIIALPSPIAAIRSVSSRQCARSSLL